MKKTILWLTVGCAGVLLVGCENFPKRKETPTADSKAPLRLPSDESPGEQPSTAGPKGFFKSTRLPGAMSSEGAEIEHSLGVQ